MATVVLPYTFADGVNMPASGAEVMANFNAILAQVNGNLQAANRLARGVIATDLANAVAEQAAIPNGSITPRDSSIVSATESLFVSTPTVMPTPDRVTVDVPASAVVRLIAYCEIAGFANGVVPTAALYMDGAVLPSGNTPTTMSASYTVGAGHPASQFFPVKTSDPVFSVGLQVGLSVSSVPIGSVGMELVFNVPAGSHTFEWRFSTTGAQQIAAGNRYLFAKAEKY